MPNVTALAQGGAKTPNGRQSRGAVAAAAERGKDGAPQPSKLRALGESVAYLKATLALVWKSSPAMTLGLGALTLVAATVPLGVAYSGKRIVDAVVAHNRDATLHWVLIELAVIVAQSAAFRGLALVRTILGARLGVDINTTILEKAVSLDLRYFENSEFYDSLTRARREASSRPVALVTDGFQVLQNVITLAGYVALLIQFSGWVILALVVATIPATVAEMRYSKKAFKLRNWRSPESRRLMYIEHVLADDDHAKEIRLFGLGDLFLGRYKVLAEAFFKEDRALAIRRGGVTHVFATVGSLAFYGAYAVMAIAAAAGHLTLGNMTLYVLAFRNGQQAFQSVLGSIGSIYEHNLYMSNLFSFLAIEPSAPEASATALVIADSNAPEVGIRFEDVGFRYPDKDVWALRHVSVFIPGGASIALVGSNGAGKTTFIKLLTRLYAPTEGRILIDGKDLRAWDEKALRARFGVVFQDFNQYQLKVGENVGLGSVAHLDESPRIERAIDRGGARELVDGLKGGLDAPLGRWFKDGTDLSGGQWQKVALARAFMREEADILVLDEPTAALDAQAEHAVFSRFRELAQGRTTIVISHRFPTVRMADRILVLEGGAVVEEGTHAALVAEGGRYAKMFTLQAEGYL